MCSTPKVSKSSEQVNSEIIQNAVPANAATQKASISNRTNTKGIVSENIRTSNNGIEEEVLSSKKKLLGE